jgi:plasmid stabilization system protein ParE
LRRIVWTDDAIANLEAIKTYVDVFDPAAAVRLAGRLVEVADSLAEFPDRGREAGGGKREMTTVWPYILRYRVQADRVIILRIRHGAQQDDAQA